MCNIHNGFSGMCTVNYGDESLISSPLLLVNFVVTRWLVSVAHDTHFSLPVPYFIACFFVHVDHYLLNFSL